LPYRHPARVDIVGDLPCVGATREFLGAPRTGIARVKVLDITLIQIASSMLEDVDSPRREYTNHALKRLADDLGDEHLFLIRSDLADYFVASFAYRPQLSARTPVARTLDNQTTFDAARPALDAWRSVGRFGVGRSGPYATLSGRRRLTRF
jgi:hypothetical protein